MSVKHMKSLFRLPLVALVLFLISCNGSLDMEPGESRVTLALQGATLEIVDRAPSDLVHPAHADHEHGATSATMVFWPDDGSESIQIEVPDSRVLLSEFGEDGNPDPVQVMSGNGLFEVDVPTIPGRFELWSSTGDLIAETAFDPDAPISRKSQLMREADIVGAPVKVVNQGSSRDKIDILFLSEGYKSSELSRFHGHVDNIVSKIKRKPVYRDVWSGFNVWRQDVRSRNSGTGSNGSAKDTAFGTAAGISGVSRCVFFTSSQGQQAAKRIGQRVGADVVVVLVNRTQTGACAGGGLIVSSNPPHVADSVAHEIGHALFGLADEYSTPRPSGQCFSGPNVATSVNNLPWSDMLTTRQLPTPISARRGTIGAFEGGGYCARGRYRPTHACLMRSLNEDLCPVCQREVRRTMARYVGGTSGGASSNSGSTTSSTGVSSNAPAAPSSLVPNGVQVPQTDVQLKWGRVSGATNYKVTLERRLGSSWRQFADFETPGTSATVRLRSEGGNYRWNIRACSSACSAVAQATFSYGASVAGTGSTGGSTSSGSSSSSKPAMPSGLKPAKSSIISDATPSLSWNAVSGADNYMFRMRWHDGDSWLSYVSEQAVSSSRVTTTLRTSERWYAFSVAACNSAGCSDWTEFSTMYLRP